MREVSEARKRLEEGRHRWVNGITASISELAGLDSSFFRSSLAWSAAKATSGSSITASYEVMAHLHGRFLRTKPPEEENRANKACAGSDSEEFGAATLGWASLCAGVATHNDDAGRIEKCDASSGAQEEHDSGGMGSSETTLHPRDTTEGYQHINTGHNTSPRGGAATTAVEIETLAAQKRCARLESLANLARQGMEAHWQAFFRDEIERTRMAAAAVDMTAERWVQRQREAVGVMWASWRDREWKSASTRGTGSRGGGVTPAAGGFCGATDTAPEDATAAATAVATASLGDPSTKEEGAAPEIADGMDGMAAAATAGADESKALPGDSGSTGTGETGERLTPSFEGATQVDDRQGNNGSGSTATKASAGGGGIRLSGDGDDVDSSCVVVVRNTRDNSSAGQQVPSADAEPPASNQIVVFVGRAMAFHMSTIRPSYMANFDEENRRRRCSSFSLSQQQGQEGQRYASYAHPTAN